MIQCILAVCGERTILDAQNNQSSIIGILEEIHSQGFPLVIPAVSCLFMIRRDVSDNSRPDSALLVKLNEDQTFKSPVQVDFGEGIKTRVFLTVNGMVVAGPGQLRFQLECENRIVGDWLIEVKKIELPQPQLNLPNSVNNADRQPRATGEVPRAAPAYKPAH